MDEATFNRRKSEFHDKLAALILEFPELAQPPHSTDCDHYHDDDLNDYDENAPKIMDGYVLVLSYQNLDGFGQMIWTTPDTQNFYMTVGMLGKCYEMI